MKTSIFIALSTFANEGREPLTMLEASRLSFKINPTGKRLTQAQLIEAAQGVDGVVAGLEPYDRQVLTSLPQLKCISRCGVGVDNVDLITAKEKNIAVLNTPSVVIQPVAEMTLGLIFDCLRKIAAHDRFLRQGQWERLGGFQLAGKTVGIIGLGRIGRRVAELLMRLDAKVIAYDVAPDSGWAQVNGVELLGLPALLSRADIVTLHVSVGDQPAFCLRSTELGLMKKEAFLINTSRGNFIDEAALVDALRTGHLAGAGLDVYASEPYQGPLSHLPNTVLTPHCSTLTKESRLAMEIEAVKNILDFFQR